MGKQIKLNFSSKKTKCFRGISKSENLSKQLKSNKNVWCAGK